MHADRHAHSYGRLVRTVSRCSPESRHPGERGQAMRDFAGRIHALVYKNDVRQSESPWV